MYCTIPMQAAPNHSFSCSIPIDGGNTFLTFRLTYNDIAEYWIVDISKDDEVLISSLPLIPGENILEQFQYLGIGSAWIIPKNEKDSQWPQANDLATDWQVVWGDTDAG